MSSSSRPTDRPDGVTVGDAHERTRRRLEAAGVESAAAEARWLIHAVTGLAPAEQGTARTRPLAPDEAGGLDALVRRREAREPLAYVLGGTEFYGLPLAVPPGVLVPRPETERLVELALADVPGHRPCVVLDVGTGSGAIALAIAAARPRARVVALDVAAEALEVAGRNARALGLGIEVLRSDLLGDARARAAAEEADVLVANLPYLPEGDRAGAPAELGYEPPEALYAGPDGLATARRLLAEASPVLSPDAVVWLELDPRTVDALAGEAEAAGWRHARTFDDLSARRRFLRVRAPRPRPAAGADPRTG